jgi:hypothetical protein
MRKKEDPEKVALRVKRYRERHKLERLEMDIPPDLKEEFKNLVGLENQKNVDKLRALINFWNGNFNPEDLSKVETSEPSVNQQLAKLLPQINEDELIKEKKELKILMENVLLRYKNSKPLDMQSYRENQKYWRELLEKKDIKKFIDKLEINLGEGVKEIIIKSYVPMIEPDVKELSKFPIELQLKIWKKSLELYSYQEGKQVYIKEVELLLSKKNKKNQS